MSERGERYARALPALITDNIGDAPLTVWTSTLQRTIQTAQDLPYNKLTWKSLDELDAGVCDGMTYEEIEVRPVSRFFISDLDLLANSKHTLTTLHIATRTSSTTGIEEANPTATSLFG